MFFSEAANIRLRAFTIIELLISMLLSGILIFLVTIVVNIVEEQIKKTTSADSSIGECFYFFTLLEDDMIHAQTIRYARPELVVSVEKSKVIRYRFEQNYVLRTIESITDTLFVRVEDFEVLQHPKYRDYVEMVSFKIPSLTADSTLSIFKSYTRSQLVNFYVKTESQDIWH